MQTLTGTAPPSSLDGPGATQPTSPSPAEPHHAVSRLTAGVGLIGAVLVLVLSLSAFVVGSHDGRPSGTEIGQYAADFSLRDGADQRVSLRQFEGNPLVLLFTTADGRDLRPNLDATAAALACGGDGLRVLAVQPEAAGTARERGDNLRQCVHGLSKRLGRPVVSLVDAEDAVAERYEVTRRPEAVVISSKGVIVDRGAAEAVLGRLSKTLAAAGPTKATPAAGPSLASLGR